MPPDPLPSVVQPMLPTLSKTPFSNLDWIFEPKWDGYRAICFVRDGEVRLVSRRRNDLTAKFPPLQSIAESIKAKSAVLDGEIVALDENGLPCFDALRSRVRVSECVIVYYAFDLLHVDGKDLTSHALIERKAALKKILPKGTKQRLRYTDHIVGKGEELLAELEKRKLEGMVAKRANSLYIGGRTRDWLKIKLDGLPSQHSKRAYERQLTEFINWFATTSQSAMSKAVVRRYATELHEAGRSSATINQALSAIRKLAVEADDNGAMDSKIANGIKAVKGVRQEGTRTGNWLTKQDAQRMLRAPVTDTLRGCGIEQS